jgi:hypothetical protein
MNIFTIFVRYSERYGEETASIITQSRQYFD